MCLIENVGSYPLAAGTISSGLILQFWWYLVLGLVPALFFYIYLVAGALRILPSRNRAQNAGYRPIIRVPYGQNADRNFLSHIYIIVFLWTKFARLLLRKYAHSCSEYAFRQVRRRLRHKEDRRWWKFMPLGSDNGDEAWLADANWSYFLRCRSLIVIVFGLLRTIPKAWLTMRY